MAKLNIVLLEPEIPANTGNIGRTCVATDTKLHLTRASWDSVSVRRHSKELVWILERSGCNDISGLRRFSGKESKCENLLCNNEGVEDLYRCANTREDCLYYVLAKEKCGIPGRNPDGT